MYERVDDRSDQLGALVLSGTSHDKGHVEETARFIQVPTTIRVCFCCIAPALVRNVDSPCGGSAGKGKPTAHHSVMEGPPTISNASAMAASSAGAR
jgi:hypothetical protein